MKLQIISDLHVRGVDDPLYAQLLRLLRERTAAGDVLVLAGDIFDLFIGEKASFSREYGEFTEAMREAGARGARIHYIEGNHDFLLKRAFSGFDNVFVHACEVTLDLEGKRFFIAHGDLVDTEDFGYRALRAVFRSLALKAAVQLMPERLVEAIGKNSSKASKQRKLIFEDHQLGPRRARLRELCRKFAQERIADGFDYVILGHTHDLDAAEFAAKQRTGFYYNVGYPPSDHSYLEWSSGETEFKRLPLS